MENKNKFWKGVMAGVFATAFVCLAAVAASVGIYMFGSQTLTRAQNSSGEASGEAASLDMEQVNQKLGVILDLINEVYLFDTDPSLEEAGIYKGLMYSLGDLYADYYTPEEMQAMQEQTTGEYCGIGAMISQDRMTNVATVTKVYKDSPAEEGGLLPGDVLYKVGDLDVTAMDLDTIVEQHVRGEENTSVSMTVYRNGEEVELTMVRRQLEIQTVEYEMLDEETGYLEVSEFDTVTAAIEETKRRRKIQQAYNEEHNITPTTIKKAVRDLISISQAAESAAADRVKDPESMDERELKQLPALCWNRNLDSAAQISSCNRVFALHDLLRRAYGHHISTVFSCSRSDIHNTVRSQHGIFVMLHHQHGISQISKVQKRL